MGRHTKRRRGKRPVLPAAGIFVLTAVLAFCLYQILGSTADRPQETRPPAVSASEASEVSETSVGSNEQTTAPSEPLSASESWEEETLPETPEARAKAMLAEMTREEKVGQMFLARCPEESAAQKAVDYHLGGYILFGRDFEGKTREQVKQNIEEYQRASEIPLLIGVDEEGGTVNRVSRYSGFRTEPFLSPQELFASGGLDAVRQDTAEKCALLRSLGINVNFAPVCDVSTDPQDFIYERAFGRDAGQTAEYVAAVAEVMAEQNMGCVLKHFPGYGDNEDTHTGIAYDGRPYTEFETSDFLPFRAGIEAGANIVLVSHNIVKSMDGERPASLSPAVHEILREELGFAGVIITDDLAMDGVRDYAGDARAAVLAVQAGNDLLCCTDFETQIPAVLAAIERGEITEERIDASVLRILRMKIILGIL
jgi:beta-N-acetylhexosaminidase